MNDYIETKNPYKLSADYHRLFALLAGYEIVGWADDHPMGDQFPTMRVACSAKRYREKTIGIGYPGRSLLSIYPFEVDEGWCNKTGRTEEELFVLLSGGISFAFIDPEVNPARVRFEGGE